MVHDERAAAFVALGLGLAGTPALLLCTSGTAAVNFHPAVVEAGLSDVPMLVLTADRPPELIGVGAPQAIDQANLFGGSVRWFHDPGVPEAAEQRHVARPRRPQPGGRVERPGAPEPALPRSAARPGRCAPAGGGGRRAEPRCGASSRGGRR